jgi:hypothetical protein
MAENYSPPVSNLLTLGDTLIRDTDRDRYEGFTREHIPELVRMVADEDLHYAEWNEDDTPPPEVFAQVHAWRVLTGLHAVEAIPAFVGLLHSIDEDDDDYIGEEIPFMLGELGAPAIDPCRAYLSDQSHGTFARVGAAHALGQIGMRHPETRDACVQALMSTLGDYQHDDVIVNAFTLSYLADLRAVEAAPLAEKIYEGGYAELEIAGDYEDYQVGVGLLEERLTPPAYGYGRDPEMQKFLEELSNQQKQTRLAEKKEKNKRKQAKKARKRHRKK